MPNKHFKAKKYCVAQLIRIKIETNWLITPKRMNETGQKPRNFLIAYNPIYCLTVIVIYVKLMKLSFSFIIVLIPKILFDA